MSLPLPHPAPPAHRAPPRVAASLAALAPAPAILAALARIAPPRSPHRRAAEFWPALTRAAAIALIAALGFAHSPPGWARSPANSGSQPTSAVPRPPRRDFPADPREYARLRLRRAGLPRAFVRELLERYDDSDRESIVALNVLGFLSRAADYDAHFSPAAVQAVREFRRERRRALAEAERRFGVAPAVIAALLWVETKHGRMLGQHPVGDTYLSLVQADHPRVRQATLAALAEKVGAPDDAQRAQVLERSATKSDWAVAELRALARLHARSPELARSLRGSFAGAFGWPQFIPSSYLRWAVPVRAPATRRQAARASAPRARAASARREADLFDPDDAVVSVASYLHRHGWKRAQPASWRDALFDYNRAEGYVNVILRIAACADGRTRESRRRYARALRGADPGCPPVTAD